MKMPYDQRLRLPDWQMKRHLQHWIFEGKCATCGRVLELELHHNSDASYARMPHERPDDLLPLCAVCHAVIEFAKKYRATILGMAQHQREKAEQLRVRLEDVREAHRADARETDELLSMAEERIRLREAMADAGREWEERRAA